MITLTTGQAISITGRLACEMGEAHKALDDLTGDTLMTHQLPRASRVAEPSVRADLPWLDGIIWPDIGGLGQEATEATITAWLGDISDVHGETHQVNDITAVWVHRDPVEEMFKMMVAAS